MTTLTIRKTSFMPYSDECGLVYVEDTPENQAKHKAINKPLIPGAALKGWWGAWLDGDFIGMRRGCQHAIAITAPENYDEIVVEGDDPEAEMARQVLAAEADAAITVEVIEEVEPPEGENVHIRLVEVTLPTGDAVQLHCCERWDNPRIVTLPEGPALNAFNEWVLPEGKRPPTPAEAAAIGFLLRNWPERPPEEEADAKETAEAEIEEA